MTHFDLSNGDADEPWRRFPSGGERVAAAGIDHLPEEQLPAFVRELYEALPRRRARSGPNVADDDASPTPARLQ